MVVCNKPFLKLIGKWRYLLCYTVNLLFILMQYRPENNNNIIIIIQIIYSTVVIVWLVHTLLNRQREVLAVLYSELYNIYVTLLLLYMYIIIPTNDSIVITHVFTKLIRFVVFFLYSKQKFLTC